MARTRFHLALVALTCAAPALAHEPAPRAVSVTGEGEVRVAPDRAQLAVGVELLREDLADAESAVNAVVRRFLDEARRLGATDDALSSSDVQVQPEYVWPKPGQERRLSGYRVGRQVRVEVRALDRLGDFIIAATRSGMNNVAPPHLAHARATALEQDALERAAKNAEAKARRLAESLGARLGAVRRIDAAVTPAPPVPFKAMALRAEAAPGNDEMGLATGEIVIRASVTAEFDLIPK